MEHVLEHDGVDEGVAVEGEARGDEDAADEGDRLPQVLVQEVTQLIVPDLGRYVVDSPAAARRNVRGDSEWRADSNNRIERGRPQLT